MRQQFFLRIIQVPQKRREDTVMVWIIEEKARVLFVHLFYELVTDFIDMDD